MSGHSGLMPGDYLDDPEIRAGYEEAPGTRKQGAPSSLAQWSGQRIVRSQAPAPSNVRSASSSSVTASAARFSRR
jgi:hypothetical protein